MLEMSRRHWVRLRNLAAVVAGGATLGAAFAAGATWPIAVSGGWAVAAIVIGLAVWPRILRMDPRSGSALEYLLPRQTNVRRVFVDDSTTPVTFWVGSNHGASIVRLQPLDE